MTKVVTKQMRGTLGPWLLEIEQTDFYGIEDHEANSESS